MKILLLGSSGFLGIYLNKVLKEKFTVMTNGLNKRTIDPRLQTQTSKQGKT